jgi:LysM repeat protein
MRIKILLNCGLIFGLLIAGCRSRVNGEIPVATPTAVLTNTPQIGVTIATKTSMPMATIEVTPDPVRTTTPKPSATPNLYIIQEGDTLFDIAANLGTTLDEILSLNPGIQPELIQVGQDLIVPARPTEQPIAEEHKQSPISLEVVTLAHYQTPQGKLWVLGEVINQNETPLTNVRIEIAIKDTRQNVVTRYSTWVVSSVIPPHTKAPFGLLIEKGPNDLEVVETRLVDGQVLPELGNQYLDLAVLDAAVTINGSSVQINGLVGNEGQQTATEIRLITTLYDDQEKVTGYLETVIPGSLAAGDTTPFQLEISTISSRTTSHSFVIQALIESVP